MCGRFTLTKDEDIIDYRFSRKSAAKLIPNYNVAPSNSVAVISQLNALQISTMKWGWSESISQSSGLIINARSESIFDKNIYKNAMQFHRCLIIADGYIEWKSTSNGKQPYYITFENKSLFTFAGLAKQIVNRNSNDISYECLIITSEANQSVNHIHHRMPFILQAEHENVWLDANLKQQDLKQIISENILPDLDSILISKNINKVSNNYPELLNQILPNPTLFD